MNIIDAMNDENLFGDQFSGESWNVWKAFLSTFSGIAQSQGAVGSGGPCRVSQRTLKLVVGGCQTQGREILQRRHWSRPKPMSSSSSGEPHHDPVPVRLPGRASALLKLD